MNALAALDGGIPGCRAELLSRSRREEEADGDDLVAHCGLVDGVMINDNKGRANANGTCVVTDADGDNIFVEWKCAGWSDWKGAY